MKEFFNYTERLLKKVLKGARSFRPIGMEVTARKIAKLVAIVGLAWLLMKGLSNFFLVWRICRTVEVIANLFAG